jgi:hypothetical protein
MNKLFLSLAVVSMSLMAAPPEGKACPQGTTCKADKACDQKACDPKDAKACAGKTCDQKDAKACAGKTCDQKEAKACDQHGSKAGKAAKAAKDAKKS